MSAGICGKRLGFEEIFGSPAPSPSPKRSRCSGYGSPIRHSELGFGSEDKVSILLRLFPSMDREVVESVLNTHDHKVDDAIKSLHALCLGDDSAINDLVILNPMVQSNDNAVEGGMNTQPSHQNVEDSQRENLDIESVNGSLWADVFVQEMMKASNWDDVRTRVVNILEGFEKSVLAHSTTSKEQEIALLKEQLQCLLRDNQILKRAVTIQHEHSLEHEEKLKEVQELKHIISQYQEQVRTLEMNNYALKIHLQRAQEGSSIPRHFNPDIF